MRILLGTGSLLPSDKHVRKDFDMNTLAFGKKLTYFFRQQHATAGNPLKSAPKL